jgi:glycosyltransferase involved in cell wall biosynthesis
MKQKCTVSIAIPAYNEEANIESILHAILLQKQKKFILKEIIVYSDGSTDKTEEKITSLGKKNPFITLIKGKKRKGKYFRINQIFKKCKSDILIVLDADIGLVGDYFLEKLVNALLSDPKAEMVSAHNVLLHPDTFIGKIIYAELMIWEYVRLSIPSRDNALNFFGSATAYRGSFARSLRIPNDLLDPHLYIYLQAKKTNGFRYCRTAEVLQWSISTISDLKKLLRRTIGKKDVKLEKIFGTQTEEIFYIPKRYKLLGLLKAFKIQPSYTFLAILLDIYITKILHSDNVNNTPIWDILESTKKIIT